MRSITRAVALICVIAVLSSLFVGCFFEKKIDVVNFKGYTGEYAGAYTMICSQVPDMSGAIYKLLSYDNPHISLLESDALNRGLYLYFESVNSPLVIGIVQKEIDGRVYFYPEDSTLAFKIPDRFYDASDNLSEKEIMRAFNELVTDVELERLKKINDWGLPMNEDKLESAILADIPITNHWDDRVGSVNLDEAVWTREMFKLAAKNGHALDEKNEDRRYFSYMRWMATDGYGRNLYYVEGYYYVYPDDPQINYVEHYLEMIAIINSDGSYDGDVFMMELSNKTKYHESLRELKRLNGWNKP